MCRLPFAVAFWVWSGAPGQGLPAVGSGFGSCSLQNLGQGLSSWGVLGLVALRRVESFKTRDWQVNSFNTGPPGMFQCYFLACISELLQNRLLVLNGPGYTSEFGNCLPQRLLSLSCSVCVCCEQARHLSSLSVSALLE